MIWLIGNKGMLGTELSNLFTARGVPFVGTDREVSILDPTALADFAAGKGIDCIVNCAAYTAVDKAETEEDLARRLNADGPENLGRLAESIGARVVHVSTDYVFDGNGTEPYKEWAHSHSWFDHIDERKIHTGTIPRLGGVGFITAYMVVLLVVLFTGSMQQAGTPSFLLMVVAMLLILVFGIWDDFKPLRARYKFLVQAVAALLILLGGYRFRSISFQEFGFFLSLGWFSYPLTLIWIIGIVNALNLIDGIDGLAGGISSIIIGSYAFIYYYRGQEEGLWLSILLIAAVLGFLVFNAPLPRARIFMGDTGSQFLGFFIALIPLLESPITGQATVSLPYAAGLTLIPIFDTFAAIWRRIPDHRNIYEPDREHTHHKLMALGFKAPMIDGILHGVQLLSSVLIVLAHSVLPAWRLELVLGAYTIVLIFFTLLHFSYTNSVKKKNITL